MPERRSAARVREPVRILFLTDDCVLDEPFRGEMLDRSSGGLRLAVPGQEICEGSMLQIRPSPARAGIPWLPVRVLNRRAIAGGWELGCQLLHQATMSSHSLSGAP